jgi:uncharacterized membrane protein YqjE
MHAGEVMPVVESASESLPTPDLVKRALAEARELVELEVRLAKAELREDLVEAKRAAVAGALAIGIALLVVDALLVAVILALGGTVAAALIVAAALAALVVVSAAVAYAAAPKTLLGKTREHLKTDATELKERVA